MDNDYNNCNHSWLDSSPFPMMALDESGAIRWVNPAFTDLLAISREEILGTTRQHPAENWLQSLFDTDDSVSIRHPDKGEILLQRIIRKVDGPSGNPFDMHYFIQPCSTEKLLQENLLLKQKVENLTLTDELTGLANERALSHNLATQVTRSRRYQNPLSVALVSLSVDDNGTHILDKHYDEITIRVSQFLRERLRWADLIARCSGGRFVIVLPETPQAEATRLFSDIVSDKDKINLPDEHSDSINLHFGIAEWQKGDDPRLLIERAATALDQD